MEQSSYSAEEVNSRLENMKKLNGQRFKIGSLDVLPLKILCNSCGKELVLYGNDIYFDTCLNIKGMGLCHDCRLIHEFDIRYYKDGHIMTYDSEKGWVTYELKRHKDNSLKGLYKKIKSIIMRAL